MIRGIRGSKRSVKRDILGLDVLRGLASDVNEMIVTNNPVTVETKEAMIELYRWRRMNGLGIFDGEPLPPEIAKEEIGKSSRNYVLARKRRQHRQFVRKEKLTTAVHACTMRGDDGMDH